MLICKGTALPLPFSRQKVWVPWYGHPYSLRLSCCNTEETRLLLSFLYSTFRSRAMECCSEPEVPVTVIVEVCGVLLDEPPQPLVPSTATSPNSISIKIPMPRARFRRLSSPTIGKKRMAKLGPAEKRRLRAVLEEVCTCTVTAVEPLPDEIVFEGEMV